MIATEVAAPFLVPFKLCLFIALFASMPYLLYQAWAFVAPGLYDSERRFAIPLLLSSILLFYAGIAFAFFIVFPLMFGFFAAVVPEGVARQRCRRRPHHGVFILVRGLRVHRHGHGPHRGRPRIHAGNARRRRERLAERRRARSGSVGIERRRPRSRPVLIHGGQGRGTLHASAARLGFGQQLGVHIRRWGSGSLDQRRRVRSVRWRRRAGIPWIGGMPGNLRGPDPP